MSLYLEDVPLGHTVELGQHTFTRDEIIDFARRFDPQRFHLSEEGGRDSLFGGLCASGWHTASVWLRLLIDHRKRDADMMRYRGERPARYGPSPGFEAIRWTKPVMAGDTIRYTTRAMEKIPSRSRPEVGLLVSHNEGFNQNGELVFAVLGKIFVEWRDQASATAKP